MLTKTLIPTFQVKEKAPLDMAFQKLPSMEGEKKYIHKGKVYLCIYMWVTEIKEVPGVCILIILFDVFR